MSRQRSNSSRETNRLVANTDRRAPEEVFAATTPPLHQMDVNRPPAKETKGDIERRMDVGRFNNGIGNCALTQTTGVYNNSVDVGEDKLPHHSLPGGIDSGITPGCIDGDLQETVQQQQAANYRHKQKIPSKVKGEMGSCDVRCTISPHSAPDPKLEETQLELDRTKEELDAVKKHILARDQELLDQHAAGKLSRPNAGVQQVGQTFLTLGEIRNKIKATMDNIVNPWTERVVDLGESLLIHDVGSIPRVLLPSLFLECLNEVESCRWNIVRIFLGNRRDRCEADMEPATATFMLEHMRRYQSTLFPLKAGEAMKNEARGRVLNRILEHLMKELHLKDDVANQLIGDSDIEKIVDAYFEIITNAELQDPRAAFTRECEQGAVQFDPNLHEKSHVDGGAFSDVKTQLCTVVFPGLLESENEQLPWTKSFIIEG